MSAVPLYLGVDGGGTGCRCRLETAEGEVLGSGIAGPASLRLGQEISLAAVLQATRGALAEAGLSETDLNRIHAGICLAGIGRKGAREGLAAWQSPFAQAIFESDGLGACLGAHAGEDGGIVIVGTGSIGLARIAGAELRIGGYGFPIGDEGSGADLGLAAIRVALRAHDGREPATRFTRDVLARFEGDPFEVVAWMDKAHATDYATLAPLVLRHADLGDAHARSIMQNAAAMIDAMVRTLFDRDVPRVSLIGGLSSAMEAWLAPDVRRRLSPVQGDAIAGALSLVRGRR
ncbi:MULTISPECIES: BadF/BadG/BcrA/BcrD ATPase family protein [unclassified Bosea (in: a-proteobacteria)]|uniref:BadF/BadG/BcrA/BcrD ATPase family protein n=1 Tax=unclassified Bosea (in: a-proteobacteria) TaxID=2653178 RepID=UPI000954346A|nr:MULTISPECIES: BadF/BadG/BcrA/BcrD ATPase family protein [unclassified Bosea (in: a-proteobacteria)]TAJ31732.1 MAG: N-acetylglucosamine kinase [Bosea sp. (in: a-proteobacteria)]SIQ29035.1 glucosamine kinase [Bosea sp. TND4EK4]